MNDPHSLSQEVYNSHEKKFLDWLIYNFGQTHAHDLAQEVWMRLFKAIQRGQWERDKGSPMAWLRTVARRLAINEAAKSNNRARREDAHFGDPSLSDDPFNSGSQHSNTASAEGLGKTAVPALSPDSDPASAVEKLLENCPGNVLNSTQRSILDAYFECRNNYGSDEETFPAVAAATGKQTGYVKAQFYKAHRELKKWLHSQDIRKPTDLL